LKNNVFLGLKNINDFLIQEKLYLC